MSTSSVNSGSQANSEAAIIIVPHVHFATVAGLEEIICTPTRYLCHVWQDLESSLVQGLKIDLYPQGGYPPQVDLYPLGGYTNSSSTVNALIVGLLTELLLQFCRSILTNAKVGLEGTSRGSKVWTHNPNWEGIKGVGSQE